MSTIAKIQRQRRKCGNGIVLWVVAGMSTCLIPYSTRNVFTLAMPITATNDLSCDAASDTCATQFNGVCESGTGSCNLDCYDCDDCAQFGQDCEACLQNGCHYCPGDATCYNSNLYTFGAASSCLSSVDYLYSGDSCETPGAVFSDPEYAGQSWVYDMINVVPVWKQGITGTGVRVRINDNGVDSSHVEFTGRFDTAGSCTNFAPQTDDPKIDHGTSVAGIVGAAANNGVCSVGIAPSVTISACNAFVETDALTQNMGLHDISQNSYGTDGCRYLTQGRRVLAPVTCPFTYVSATTASPCDVCQDFSQPSEECAQAIRDHCSLHYAEDQLGCLDFLSLILGGNCVFDTLTDYEREALTQGVVEGRQGKGIIFVFASGNAFDQGDETAFQSYSNSRFVISVGAVAKDRTHASYSTPGSSLFVTGPGGDSDSVTNHVTIGVGKACRDAGIGTSFACPVVTGVVALILEVNPNLTWRDVQCILAQTSQRVDDPQDTTAFQNAAGYWHSHWYGFGIVDAEAAVTAARDWVAVGPEQMVLAESGLLNQPIVDDESVFLETSVTVKAPANFSAESVELQLDIDSFSRGDLEIILTSPLGTKSILSPGRRPENTQVADRWKLLTVRHWGENPNGEWTLTIVDLVKGDVGDCGSQDWSTTVGGQLVDCNYLEAMNLCADGQLDPAGVLSQDLYDAIFTYQDNGVLAEQACCACGGGWTASQFSDQLKQWTVVVYGTNQTLPSPGGSTPAPATTKTPNTVPTRSPVQSPTKSPGQSPTKSPVQSPTKSPTSGTGTLDQSQPAPPTFDRNATSGANVTDTPTTAPVFSFGPKVPTPPPVKVPSTAPNTPTSSASAPPGTAETGAPVFAFGPKPPSPPPTAPSATSNTSTTQDQTAVESPSPSSNSVESPSPSSNSSMTFSPSPSMNSSNTFSPSPSSNSSITFSPSPSVNSSSSPSVNASISPSPTSSPPSPSPSSATTEEPEPSTSNAEGASKPSSASSLAGSLPHGIFGLLEVLLTASMVLLLAGCDDC